MEKAKSFSSEKCCVCFSSDLVQLYSENIDIDKINFTYEFSPQSTKTFRVVRCRSCTHVFCSPLPANLYKKYEDVVDDEYLKHEKTRALSSREILKIIGKYKAKGQLLDVGCATGDFLVEAKRAGYEVEGLELSRWSASITRKKGFRVYEKTLEFLSCARPGKYDIVSLLGVIEHFENPKGEMEYIYELLAPGGVLVLWTGDVDSITSRALKKKWWYWQGQHIQYFTHRSLNFLAESKGFTHMKTMNYPLAVDFEQVKNSLGRYRFNKYLSTLIKPFFLMRKVWYLSLPGEMFWIGKKSE